MSVKLTAVPADDESDRWQLYSGWVDPQGDGAGDGEVVLQPRSSERPHKYDYVLSIV